MVAPLTTLLALLAVLSPRADACQFGPPGHVHVFASPAPDATAPRVEIGRCGGQGTAQPAALPADPASPPMSLQKTGIDEKGRKAMTLAGYRLDAGADRFYAPASAVPVSERDYERLLSPIDASKETVPYEIWLGLQLQGYRLDENSCVLSHPERGPLRHIDMSLLGSGADKGHNHAALESLLAELKKLPLDKPIPKSLVEKMMAMEKTGLRLQENVRSQLLAGTPPTAANLGASAGAAYRASTLYFDGARDFGSFVTAATPGGAAPKVKVPVADEETRMGRMLAKEFEAAFERVEPGRELLEHFRGKDGVVQLPPILCLKLTQKPGDADIGALNDPSTKQVVINHWMIASAAVSVAPKEDQARLAVELANPTALRRYLEAHPDARKKVVDLMDASVFHELVHYRQGDLSRADVETMRGNLPAVAPLSYEQEAHRRTCLYALARQNLDPSLAVFNYGSTTASDCRQLLASTDAFEARVNDTYRRNYSWFGDLPDVARRQQVRKDASDGILWGMWSSLRQRAEQALKLQGMSQGDAALIEEEKRIKADRTKFDLELKPIRAQWLSTVPPKLVASGRPDSALTALEAVGLDETEAQAREAARALGGLLSARRLNATTMERVAAFQAYDRVAKRFGLSVDLPMFKGYAADVRQMIAEAKKNPVPGMDLAAWEQSLASLEKSILEAERPRPAGAPK